ncbi:MAG: hypothetical protein AMXMBFR13_42900 [Phycisphaerae bacterium]
MSDTIPPPNSEGPPVANDRRRLCQMAIGGMAAVSVATVGYPVVSFLRLPTSTHQEESVEVPVEELTADQAVWSEKGGQQVVIIRTSEGPQAFNGACPHLGCVVQWDGTSRTFKCPCHGAAFDDQGRPVSGPVNTPLKRIKFEVKEGVLKLV